MGPDEILDKVNQNRRVKNLTRNYAWFYNEAKMEGTLEDNGPYQPESMYKEIVKRPTTVRIFNSDRSYENLFLYWVYKVLRFIHVVIWFYQLPFIFLLAMYIVPIRISYMKKKEFDDSVDSVEQA